MNCHNCNKEFAPREARARFCCRDCGIEFFANERREAVQRLRQQRQVEGATYFSQAQFDAEASGAYVTGSGAPPPLPAAPYPADPGGSDPLGFCIDDLPDMERNQ
jgi:predicted RNA-binding Zn-ribbon protein involved in translation (DUF1610 family)